MPDLPESFLALCHSITAIRPKTVIGHILEFGSITTEDLKTKYGYNHPPRAIRDVREQGIPLVTFRVQGSDGRTIAAYKFGDTNLVKPVRNTGRTVLTRKLKNELVQRHGSKCFLYLEELPQSELQIDHRIPYEVGGDIGLSTLNAEDFMLLCGSANRAKSWSCEHCNNWLNEKIVDVCRKCYWAYPEEYDHIAMREVRRLDILWQGSETAHYDQLKALASDYGSELPDFVKMILNRELVKIEDS